MYTVAGAKSGDFAPAFHNNILRILEYLVIEKFPKTTSLKSS